MWEYVVSSIIRVFRYEALLHAVNSPQLEINVGYNKPCDKKISLGYVPQIYSHHPKIYQDQINKFKAKSTNAARGI